MPRAFAPAVTPHNPVGHSTTMGTSQQGPTRCLFAAHTCRVTHTNVCPQTLASCCSGPNHPVPHSCDKHLTLLSPIWKIELFSFTLGPSAGWCKWVNVLWLGPRLMSPCWSRRAHLFYPTPASMPLVFGSPSVSALPPHACNISGVCPAPKGRKMGISQNLSMRKKFDNLVRAWKAELKTSLRSRNGWWYQDWLSKEETRETD